MRKYIYKYDIGDEIKTEFKELIVIDRKCEPFIDKVNGYEKSRKYYKINCKKCGFDSNEHYFNGKFKKEYWISEQALNKRKYCPCCNNIVICKDINSIYATDSWMVDYFKNHEDGYKYSSRSNKEIEMKCKFCNEDLGLCKISTLYAMGKMTCGCNDSISFPNKISYYFFKELKEQLLLYKREFCPSWISPYRYDNYIILNNGKEYIIEMDGEIGHGNMDIHTGQKDTVGKNRDVYKDRIAQNHGIDVIRINCTNTDFDSIKNNLISSLSSILNLKNVNWDNIHYNSMKNIVHEVCNIYKKVKSTNPSYYPFDLSSVCIRNYLKLGKTFSLCEYKTLNERRVEKAKLISEARINNPTIPTSELKEIIGSKEARNHSVYKYMELANELGFYNFDIEKEKKVNRSKGVNEYRLIRCKKISAYDKDMNLVGTFESTQKLIEYFQENFNIKLQATNVGKVCNGKLHHTKNYIFKYV